MKAAVERALEEVNSTITLIDVGMAILNSLLIFAFFLLAAVVFSFSILFALIPALISLGYFVFRIFRKNKYSAVEDKVDDLRYQLTTVADNVYRTNPIVDSLKEDVVKNMHKINASDFIEDKKIIGRVALLTVISILVIFASYKNLDLDLKLDIPSITRNIVGVREMGQNVSDLNLTYIEGNFTDLFGRGSIAQLGTGELQLIVNPLASDVDVGNFKEASDAEFIEPGFPKEIYTSYDSAYQERIAKKNQRVVREYFEQIVR